MKYLIFLLLSISIVTFFSCKNDEAIVNMKSSQNTSLNKPPQPSQPLIHAGVWWHPNDIPGYIGYYGPDNQGWSSILLETHFWSNHGEETSYANYTAATAACYYPILANIFREAVCNQDPSQWASDPQSIYAEINNAKNARARWIYLDDGLTKFYNGEQNDITDNKMQILCDYVHSHGMLIAVGEDCNTMMTNRRIIIRKNFYKYVDFIMPYGYSQSISQLTQFYNTITYNIKPINVRNIKFIPILNHTQKSRSYIEFASQWAEYSHLVFFYPGADDLSSLYSLNQYLHENNFLFPAL